MSTNDVPEASHRDGDTGLGCLEFGLEAPHLPKVLVGNERCAHRSAHASHSLVWATGWSGSAHGENGDG